VRERDSKKQKEKDKTDREIYPEKIGKRERQTNKDIKKI
jgi:hypothetical protein